MLIALLNVFLHGNVKHIKIMLYFDLILTKQTTMTPIKPTFRQLPLKNPYNKTKPGTYLYITPMGFLINILIEHRTIILN